MIPAETIPQSTVEPQVEHAAESAMETRDTVKILLEELLAFSREAKFAVEQENWPYLNTILQKKEGHLHLLKALTDADNLKAWGLGELAHQLQAAEVAACAAIELKLAQAREKQAELDVVKNRTTKVRKMTKLQTPEQVKWKATA